MDSPASLYPAQRVPGRRDCRTSVRFVRIDFVRDVLLVLAVAGRHAAAIGHGHIPDLAVPVARTLAAVGFAVLVVHTPAAVPVVDRATAFGAAACHRSVQTHRPVRVEGAVRRPDRPAWAVGGRHCHTAQEPADQAAPVGPVGPPVDLHTVPDCRTVAWYCRPQCRCCRRRVGIPTSLQLLHRLGARKAWLCGRHRWFRRQSARQRHILCPCSVSGESAFARWPAGAAGRAVGWPPLCQ
mmetsp:Transcript_24163/g.69456  ORF Transcript_24163/g.69456 Transcript_24163/m.69456 type:complete len:239 (+) Transcript_24163:591-1307(+)